MKKVLHNLKKLFFILSVFYYTQNSFAQTSPATYSATGSTQTFTVPTGVTRIQVEVYGGGGAGGGATGSPSGGGYVRNTAYTVVPGTTYNLYVGYGGAGVTGADGNDGQASWFNTSSLIKAVGGNGGNNENGNGQSEPGATAPSSGNIGFSSTFSYYGGNGGTGLLGLTAGGGGSSPGTGSNGNAGLVAAGGLAPTGGYAGATAGSGNGADATGYGSGGAGGRATSTTDRSGGDGSNGRVIITWVSQEINVQGNSNTILSGDVTPSLTDGSNFGAQYILTGTITKTFTIQNTSTGSNNVASLKINSVTITGTNAADFTLTASPATTIAGGSSTTFSITFDPNGSGTRTATISISNDDPDDSEDPYTFSISGTGNLYTDSDGDGITDESDIDDDNDGVRDTDEQAGCIASPIASSVETTFLNETFGTGTSYTEIDENITTATTTYDYISGGDVNDGYYTVKNSAQITSWASAYWHNGTDHTGDTNGKMAIFNADYAAGEFYRTNITGITANIPVKYSFWVINLDRADAPSIGTRIRPNVKVEFRKTSDNSLITSLQTGNITPTVNTTGAGSWYNFYSEFTPTETSFKVIFINNSTGGTGNDLALDDIKITQKYCDMDSDGDADIFDLDDDNDGIPDIVEVGFKAYSANKSKMDMTNNTIWKDLNSNGMNDAMDTLISNGTYASYLVDTDGDGTKDFFDIDSDNDSIFDIDEAQTDTFAAAYNGDGDIDGDGKGDGADIDNDGIRDLNDDLTSTYGTTNKAYPADTDADGTPDYKDVTSNGSSKDIAGTIYASLDGNNDGKIDGSTDVDKDGALDSFDGSTTAIGSPRNITTKTLLIDFDGRNDYAEGAQLLSGQSKATIMGWIKLDASFASTSIVLGQDNFYLSIDGATKRLIAKAGSYSTTASAATALTLSRWTHVAATYNGSNLTLYINGTSVATTTTGASLAASTAKFTIAKKSGALSDYFRGYIDEVRVFNLDLTADQLQKMVYQKIDQNGTGIQGAIIPKTIESATWASLKAYYRMDVYKNNVTDDYTISGTDDSASNTAFCRIYNVKYLKTENAPLPFVTRQTGALDGSAITDATNFINGADVAANNYSIIQVKHDVTLANNFTNLGLIVDSTKKITVNNDNKIENSWYLSLQGTIDLQGKSQLVQGINSDLASTTTGYIERDQQGSKNLYNYNYWSSPVSTISSATVNNGYTVNGVMKDGTNPASLQNITWTNDYDGAATTPITLSRFWIYKYQNVANDYANWTYVGETGTLNAGQGYTLKGSNASTSTQNYTFVGKPNNGTITSAIAVSNLNLSGNPYPSAINATTFIKDNIVASSPAANPGTSGAIEGSLYFWEHAPNNTSHNYANYKGGYAVRNLVGGTPPQSSPTGTNGIGNTSKTPYEYIPVGQAFFVQGSTTGGLITFKNSQRAFVKETDPESNVLFRNAGTTTYANATNSNDPTPTETENFIKVRIGFNNSVNIHRQLLIGFMNENATDGFDKGYDALNFDTNPSDMYFKNGDNHLLIQGVGTFSPANTYPLGVTADETGAVSFVLDGVENMDENQEIFIYDALDNTYHDIRNGNFETTLETGSFEERFSLRFINPLGIENPTTVKDEIQIAYTNSNEMLTIKNNLPDTTVESAALFNILGQQISYWNVENVSQENIEIPIASMSTGTYIVNVKTNNGTVAKKIVIR